MKFYYKERTAKNQCKVLSEEKGMLTIQMRNGGKFLVSKKSVLKEDINNVFDKAFSVAANDLQGGTIKNPKAYGYNIARNSSTELHRGLSLDDKQSWANADEFLSGFIEGIKKAMQG